MIRITINGNSRSDNNESKSVIKCGVGGLICMAMASVILGIISLVIGSYKQNGDCPHIDEKMGLTIDNYLIGIGVAQLIFGLTIIIMIYAAANSSFDSNSDTCVLGFGSILIVIIKLFKFAWFIVGAIILFRSNIECINSGETKTVYALVMWIFSAITVLQSNDSDK